MTNGVSEEMTVNFENEKSSKNCLESTPNLVKQSRDGLKLNLCLFHLKHIILITNNWPSFLWHLLPMVSCRVRLVLVQKNEMVEEVKGCWGDTVDIMDINSSTTVLEKEHLVFIIGDLYPLNKLAISLLDKKRHKIFMAFPYVRERKNPLFKYAHWCRIKHSALGGVTDKLWMFGSNSSSRGFETVKKLSNFGFERSFLDIIDEGQTGSICSHPQLTKSKRIANVNSIHNSHVLPSYRSRTGWVLRKFTLFELGLMLDINEKTMKSIIISENFNFFKNDQLAFMKPMPGKFCEFLKHWVLDLFGTSIAINKKHLKNPKVVNEKSETKNINSVLSQKDLDYLAFEQRYLVSYGQKAAKGDDEKVPVELWDRNILRQYFSHLNYNEKVAKAFDVLRNKIAFKWYLRCLRKSFFKYLRMTYGKNYWDFTKNSSSRKRNQQGYVMEDEFKKDILVGRDAIERASLSSWWEWSSGSTCFFWRWPEPIRRSVRDGFEVFVEGKMPCYKQKQVFHLSGKEKEKLASKITKIVKRGYLEKGYVRSLINFFAVPKGESDIRIVYDGTKCGLNQIVWAPNFHLPMVDSLLDISSTSTWFADMDLGEMFLNYNLDSRLRPYSGVDVSNVLGNGDDDKLWLRWNRTLMGFRSSPYIACKSYGWCTDVIRGDKKDPQNPFRWNWVRLNLPGDEAYDPTFPWVSKMNGDQEANDLKVYVDDVRPVGSSEQGCRQTRAHASKRTQYLGQQDAARKYRPPSQEPGPWCGAFIAVRNENVWAYVSVEKWNKGKSYVNRWFQEVMKHEQISDAKLDFKDLERGRGFLVYLSRTYTSMTPYLKGIHLTLDSWREGRDSDGWKWMNTSRRNAEESSIEMKTTLVEKSSSSQGHLEKPPPFVIPVPRFKEDISALKELFSPVDPPWRFVRGKKIYIAKYGFGDASKSGFGSTFMRNDGIAFRYGTWAGDGRDSSSNFRELENLAQALELEVESNEMNGMEVFIFTDNSTAESAYFKGTSSSKQLFNIVLRLRKLELNTGIKLHFIHVAGSRMIDQGTDGLSRGDIGEGVMVGQPMLSFVPLHKTALQRSDSLKTWIISWLNPCLTKGEQLEFLDENDWFCRGHDVLGGAKNPDGIFIPHFKAGVMIWTPPPAAAHVAIEQLREARNKRTESFHVILLPRLFTSLWRRQLWRVSDLHFELPFITNIWEKDKYHEPLILTFVLPFLRHHPWQLRRSKSFLEMDRLLPQMWKKSPSSTGTLLCQLCTQSRKLASMPEGLVCKVLQSASHFEFLHSKTN